MKKQVLQLLTLSMLISATTIYASQRYRKQTGGDAPGVTPVVHRPGTPPAAGIPATADGLKKALASGAAADGNVAAGLADGLEDLAAGADKSSPAYQAAYQFASGRAPEGGAGKASKRLGRMGK